MCAGKSQIAECLKNKGFECYVCSDILKEIAQQRNIDSTRANLQKLGNDIKKENKNLGILSEIILTKIKTDNAVIDGIRNTGEIKELKKRENIYILGVNAPPRLRYKRLRKRNRKGEPKVFFEFKRLDNRENRGKTKAQEINKCLKIADFVVINNGSLEELTKKIDKLFKL